MPLPMTTTVSGRLGDDARAESVLSPFSARFEGARERAGEGTRAVSVMPLFLYTGPTSTAQAL